MHLLTLEHMDGGDLGGLGEFFLDDGGTWDTVRLDLGESLPSMQDYDGIWVMGGPMQVWQEEAHPWLVEEKAFIRNAVGSGVPFLGVCLGHQLLAVALGGLVGPSRTPEIGILEVELTEAGGRNVFLEGAASGPRLMWHKAEVVRPPSGALILASTKTCPVQAMAVGKRAFSVQYHVEAGEETLLNWCREPAVEAELDEQFGERGLDRLLEAMTSVKSLLQAHARLVYQNWIRCVLGIS